MGKNPVSELYDIERLIIEIEEIILNENITRHTKSHYLRNVAIQTFTEHYPNKRSKINGCRFWSEKAYNQQFNDKYEGQKENLFHEHVIPKKWLIEEIFLGEDEDIKKITKDYIEYYFKNFIFACVVTESEHKENLKSYANTMPLEFLDIDHDDYLKVWIRYIYSDIQVLEISWNDKKKPISHKNIDLNSFEIDPSVFNRTSQQKA